MEFPLKTHRRGFSILELLVAMTVLVLMLVLLLPVVSNVTRVTTSNPPTFQEARTAFETMTRLLGQALLNTYWDYDDPRNPQRYVRASELHFVGGPAPTLTGFPGTAGSAVFFQAPLSQGADRELKSQPGLLNSVGFYTRFSESEHLPSYLQSEKSATAAWRLWMYLQPAEDFAVYSLYNGSPQAASNLSWFRSDLNTAARNHVLANNVILLLIRASYKNSAGQQVMSYAYDSRPMPSGTAQPVEMHQIPPLLHASLVVIDQRTADRLLLASNGQSYNLIPGDLFSDASEYTADMTRLQDHLNSRPIGDVPIHYRIFEAAIPMSSAKWSQF